MLLFEAIGCKAQSNCHVAYPCLPAHDFVLSSDAGTLGSLKAGFHMIADRRSQ